MSKSATRLLTLAIFATGLVAVPMITPAKAATISSEEEKAKKKIQTSPGFSDPRSGGRGLLPKLRLWEVASSNI